MRRSEMRISGGNNLGKRILAVLLLMVWMTAGIAGCGQKEQETAVQAEDAAAAPEAAAEDLYYARQEPRESPAWVTELEVAQDPDLKQLIVVAGVDKTTAYVTMHERNADGKWMQLIATPGFIGLDGLGEANINDSYTPVGTFLIDRAFGLAPDPGCQMPYIQVDDSYYWSGDLREGMHFNKLVSINDVPYLDKTSSEHIADFDYAYRYCLNLGYNAECEPEKGFAFFLHSFRVNRPYTGGCVAVPESIMKFIMQNVRYGCKITIDSLENFGGSLDD